MNKKTRVLKKTACLVLAGMILIGLLSCASLSKFERRMKKMTDLDIDVSGCRITEEKDTHAAMGDGEYLLILDCKGHEESILEQTREWAELPMTSNLQAVMSRGGRLSEQYGIPQIGKGVWYYYDRYPDAVHDKHSDEALLTRPAQNFTLILYDSENSMLYFYECDT